MDPLLVTAVAVYGALVGLLLDRPAYRLSVEPEQPWRSACPGGHPLGGSSVGWLGLARCPRCPPGERWYGGRGDTSEPPPDSVRGDTRGWGRVRLPVLVACCCAALAAAVGARPELAVWLLVAPVGVLLATVDRAVKRLPDVLTLPLAAALIAGLAGCVPLPDAGGDWSRALWAGAVLSLVYFVLFLISPNAVGFGDVKLAVALGVALGWYGWDAVVFGTFAGFLLASGYALWLIVRGLADRKSDVPLGPFLTAGALVALLLGGLAA
ncbi:A24 family peptidase [Streptomyces sp. B6B3]|uniref:A24 family peptidase n=1 Tax=Streptomyces sp. B6B3 TaxID=3153570 RepID=UPI00325E1555